MLNFVQHKTINSLVLTYNNKNNLFKQYIYLQEYSIQFIYADMLGGAHMSDCV